MAGPAGAHLESTPETAQVSVGHINPSGEPAAHVPPLTARAFSPVGS
jgi:hypothetical protein